MKLPPKILRRFQAFGRAGGRRRARAMTPFERRAVAATGAIRRWTAARFGEGTFEALGLPGGEIVDRGLRDMAYGRRTQEAFLVALAAPRLARERVPLPKRPADWMDPDLLLFREIETNTADADLAFSRYNAARQRIDSFADALRAIAE